MGLLDSNEVIHIMYFGVYPLIAFFQYMCLEYRGCACMMVMIGNICECIFYMTYIVLYPDFSFHLPVIFWALEFMIFIGYLMF